MIRAWVACMARVMDGPRSGFLFSFALAFLVV